MGIRSLTGTEIDYAMTLAMNSVLSALVQEGAITEAVAYNFADTHIVVQASNDNIWNRTLKYLKIKLDDTQSMPMVLKIVSKPQVINA